MPLVVGPLSTKPMAAEAIRVVVAVQAQQQEGSGQSQPHVVAGAQAQHIQVMIDHHRPRMASLNLLSYGLLLLAQCHARAHVRSRLHNPLEERGGRILRLEILGVGGILRSQ